MLDLPSVLSRSTAPLRRHISTLSGNNVKEKKRYSHNDISMLGDIERIAYIERIASIALFLFVFYLAQYSFTSMSHANSPIVYPNSKSHVET